MTDWNTLIDRNYVPYSGKTECCVVIGKSGMGYPGIRIENISYPLTITAVQCAIYTCVSNGDTPLRIILEANYGIETEYWEKEYGVKSEVGDFPEFEMYKAFYTPDKKIKEELISLGKHTYAVNSEFPVAALLKTEMGYVAGLNVECSSWPLGLCAERMALTKSLAAGCKTFTSLEIYAPKGEFNSPCGACRQVLNEWISDKRVVLHHGDGTQSGHIMQHFLPYSFSSPVLKNK